MCTAAGGGAMAVPTVEAELAVHLEAHLGEGSIWDRRRPA